MACWEMYTPDNGRQIEILKVGGGWPLRCFCGSEDKTVIFIPDQNHENKPIPMDN